MAKARDLDQSVRVHRHARAYMTQNNTERWLFQPFDRRSVRDLFFSPSVTLITCCAKSRSRKVPSGYVLNHPRQGMTYVTLALLPA